jgi:hypothetical protein
MVALVQREADEGKGSHKRIKLDKMGEITNLTWTGLWHKRAPFENK